MTDLMQQTTQDVSLLAEEIDRAIDTVEAERNGERAIGLLMQMQFNIGASWLRVGRLATIIKAYKLWEGKAETWTDFIKDRFFFKVGASEVLKSMRLWNFYCRKQGIPQAELVGYAQDALDAAKPLVKQEGWDEAKKHLDLKQGDLRETIKDRTGQEPDWNAFTDRAVATFKKLQQGGMEPWLEMFLRETGLNHFEHQKKCAICGVYAWLHPHHDPPKSQGGKGIGNVILCRDCHRKHHDGQLTEAEQAKYRMALQ